MNEESRYKGMQLFGIGVLLLGASAVLSLLRTGAFMMSVSCAAAAIGECLMAVSALAARKYAGQFRTGGLLLLLATIFRVAGPVLQYTGVAWKNEIMAMVNGGAAVLAILFDILGVAAVLAGCLKVEKERGLGRALTALCIVGYPVILAAGQAFPFLLAVKYTGEKNMVLGGITIAALLVFLIAFLTAAASQSAFRKVDVDYRQEPGTRKHIERPVSERTGKKRGRSHGRLSKDE